MGDLRTMNAEEMFFSTTDRRGVIRQGNSVFVRVSGYPLEELVGAPHNTVRHPEMPAGLFRLVWDGLNAGRPVGAYIKNRTKDGGSYWVFAAIGPLHDGYVSIRTAPHSPLFELIQRVYAHALRVERAAIHENGMSRHEAALLGAAEIEASLWKRGYSSYREFMLHALPEEVAARSQVVSMVYDRPGARGSIAEVLAGTGALDGVLDELVGRLAGYQKLGDELASTSTRVLDIAHRLHASVTAAQQASELVEDSAPVLANVARVMAKPMTRSVTALERLQTEFGRLKSDIAHLRFQISLASLYNDMAAAFAAEVFDGDAPPESLGAVPLLCDAAEAVIVEMSEQVQRVNAALRGVAGLVAETGTLLEEFRRFIGQWRNLVLRHKAGPALGDKVRPIDTEISASWEWMELLRTLGRQYESAIVPFDPAFLQTHLDKIRIAPAAL
ncbi:PAS domain-containing protein [Actinocorallia populi]|uniref:PAS domain-containing protein n=1 Tax=Actinocorallia populi TaxID=2079200 RepID=UPI000D08971C|nr:PAS domain-containing protein [Actinocorallia populi]